MELWNSGTLELWNRSSLLYGLTGWLIFCWLLALARSPDITSDFSTVIHMSEGR